MQTNRRSFLKATGITALGISSVLSVVQGSEDETGADDLGLKNVVRKLMRAGKADKADNLLNRHDVDHFVTSLEPAQGSNGVSTQDIYGYGDSSIDFFGYHGSGNLYTVELWWDVEFDRSSFECGAPNEVAAFTFEGARWEYEKSSASYPSQAEAFRSDTDGVKVEWPGNVGPETGQIDGHFWVTLEKNAAYADQAHNVWGHFTHNWTPQWKGYCLTALLGQSVSMSPGILSIDSTADSWEKRKLKEI